MTCHGRLGASSRRCCCTVGSGGISGFRRPRTAGATGGSRRSGSTRVGCRRRAGGKAKTGDAWVEGIHPQGASDHIVSERARSRWFRRQWHRGLYPPPVARRHDAAVNVLMATEPLHVRF